MEAISFFLSLHYMTRNPYENSTIAASIHPFAGCILVLCIPPKKTKWMTEFNSTTLPFNRKKKGKRKKKISREITFQQQLKA
jgi:hypothetical protein